MINRLAIHGGKKTRIKKMPPRNAFGANEIRSLKETIKFYETRKLDPQYKDKYESKFSNQFNSYMGGGKSISVSSGTGAVIVAVQALSLKKGSEIIVSPFFEAGPLSGLILLGYKTIVADAKRGSFNVDLKQILKKITKKTSAIILVHSAGDPIDIEPIIKEMKKRNIKVIEDTSQSPGATYNKKKLGTYGDICAISTMFSKTLTTCGSGGIVFTNKKKYFNNILAFSDRGKPIWKKNIDRRDPSKNLFPAFNWNSNEFSAAIAIASLKRLNQTILNRRKIINKISRKLSKLSVVCRGYEFNTGYSPYYFPIWVKKKKIKCSKKNFAKAIIAEGINLNPDYKFLCEDWEWAQKKIETKIFTPNAKETRENTFNLYVNENFKAREVEDIIKAIIKVEKYYLKK